MSNEVLKQFMSSGKQLIEDTKVPRKMTEKKASAVKSHPDELGDPHKVFIRRTIQEKSKKADVVKEFEKFIKIEEDKL